MLVQAVLLNLMLSSQVMLNIREQQNHDASLRDRVTVDGEGNQIVASSLKLIFGKFDSLLNGLTWSEEAIIVIPTNSQRSVQVCPFLIFFVFKVQRRTVDVVLAHFLRKEDSSSDH